MKILSFDIGIRNLAYCYMEITSDQVYTILDWNVIDLCYEDNIKSKCTACKKNGEVCNKTAAYRKNEEFYCRTHAKNCRKWVIMDKETKINKHTKNSDLMKIFSKYNIKIGDEKQTKKGLIEKINEFVADKCLEEIDNRNKVNASKLNLIEIGRRINKELSKLFKDDIDHVIIENQIGPLANRMKSIQCFIAMYFIMNGVNNIEFISSSNKLCQVDKDCKDKYSKRKVLSIKKTRDIIDKDTQFSSWLPAFNSSKKQDDLGDSFLQCLWFINKYKLLDKFISYF